MNESKKMLEIIHTNRNKVYEENTKKEEIKTKKEKRTRRIELLVLGILLITTMLIYGIYSHKHIKSCMEDGYSETFCRYAGE